MCSVCPSWPCEGVGIIEFFDYSMNIIDERPPINDSQYTAYVSHIQRFNQLVQLLMRDPCVTEPHTRKLFNELSTISFIRKCNIKPFIPNQNLSKRTYKDGPYIHHVRFGANILNLIDRI